MYHRAPGITSLVEIAGRTGRSGVACGMRLAGVARRTTLAATMLLIALGGTVEAQQATIAARTTAHDRFTPPLDRGIAVKFDRTPLADALRTIASASNVQIAFSDRLLPDTRVTLQTESMSARAVLTTVL